MNYIEFREQWISYGCFNINQIYAWQPDFNRLNLRNWIKKGYILKLRNGYYAFEECRGIPDFDRYIANKIYRPSYISLFSALSFYGIIPEAVPQIMSVTSLKTSHFENAFGNFVYKSVKPELMFGYKGLTMRDGKVVMMAILEKALLDVLYLYPFYKSTQDMIDLRLDEDLLEEEFNKELFLTYLQKFNSQALTQRATVLLNAYSL